MEEEGMKSPIDAGKACKHYYDDYGNLDYVVDNKQLIYDLAVALNIPGMTPEEGKIAASNIRDNAISLIYEYSIHAALGSCLGGCLTVDGWRYVQEKTEERMALKAIFLDFVDNGYVWREFILVAESVRATIIFNLYDFGD